MTPESTLSITVVSGLPRSGTSLMMQMISAGGIAALSDHLRTPDDDNPRGYFELEAVKKTRHDPAWLRDAPGKVVKMVHLLLYDLPADLRYNVILMRRATGEVLASQRKMLQRQGKSGASISDEQLAKVFGEQMQKLVDWLAGRPNFRVLEVDYNALIADPPAGVAAVNQFLGGSLDSMKMLAAVDPALYRNRG